jgi:hypothetical protein
MSKSLAFLRHRYNGLIVLLALVTLVTGVSAQTTVAAPPWFKQQYFKATGVPNAFGCIFTYVSGSTTPLSTFTDYTGATQNSNPIDLDAGGFAGTSGTGMWLRAGTAYRVTLKTSGGSHCATGSTIWSMDGVGGGVTINTTTVTYSATPSFPIVAQNQLFKITLTGNAVAQPLTAVGILPPAWIAFEITQDGAGGHSFVWPSNSVGGSLVGQTANQTTQQMFFWDGSTAKPVGPALAGQVPALSADLLNWLGDGNFAGDVTVTGFAKATTFRSNCATPLSTTGTVRLCKTDSVRWRNNGDSGDQGITPDTSDRGVWSFSGGLVLQGTNPSMFMGGTTASFPYLKRNSTAVNFRLGDDSADAPITASTANFSGVVTSTASTFSFKLPVLSDPGAAAASTMSVYGKTSHGVCAEDSSSVVYCMLAGAGSIGKIQTVRSTSNCTTGSTGHDSCNDTFTWPVTFGDTNYSPVCSGADSSIGSAGETAILFSYTATTFSVSPLPKLRS